MKNKTAVALFLTLCSISLSSFASAQSPLVVGVFPRRDPAITITLFKPLRDYLAKELDMPVRLETARDFTSFELRLAQQRYDIVHLNQYQYITAHEQAGYDVIVQNEEFGEKDISGAIYVRKDSNLTSLSQLKGKNILFGGGDKAMMSYIVPTYLLKKAGLKRGDYLENFSKSPPNAVLATYMKQCDAGGAGEIVLKLPLVKNKIDTTKMTILAHSQPLPHLPWATKQDMDPSLKMKIQKIFMTLKDSAKGQAVLKAARLTGLNPAQDSDYDIHRKIIAEVEND
ncbi:MAG: phosphate/phosphite/phosphonate ABC transporter substrate-binding protein [Methylocystaceae bacterium]|nr:phosphate/phosphite/phosphonate ABC transporter substrate-binding protein [Methylocystaceae bacterium]